MPHHKVSDGIGSGGCALSNWMMGNCPNPQNTSLLKHPAGQGLSQLLVTSLFISKNIPIMHYKMLNKWRTFSMAQLVKLKALTSQLIEHKRIDISG